MMNINRVFGVSLVWAACHLSLQAGLVLNADTVALGEAYNGSIGNMRPTSPYYNAALRAGNSDGGNFYKGYVWFDIQGHQTQVQQSSTITLTCRLNALWEEGGQTVYPLHLQFLGTRASTTLDEALWDATPVIQYPSVLTHASVPGLHSTDVSSLRSETLAQRYLVFGFIPSGSDMLWQDHYYEFDHTLTATQLEVVPVPEAGTWGLFSSLALLGAAGWRRQGSAARRAGS